MLARVSRGSFGLSQYLITGKRKDSQFSRDKKDKVTSLYGDLNLFAETEKWLVSNKNYKDNYLHLTLGFSKDDMSAIESAPNKDELLADLARDYIAYYTTGYDLDSEVIAYAEAHEPIIKTNEKGKERLSHIHIAIALYNPQTDKQLRPPFFNLKRDDAFKSQMCEKYGLEKPVRDFQREREDLSFWGKNRARLVDFLNKKGFKNGKEAILWLKENNTPYKVVKTGKNHYIKLIGENGCFNIRGRGLEHLELGKSQKISQTPINTRDNIPINPDVTNADLSELKKEIRDEALEKWRKKRTAEIDKARKTHKKQQNSESCAISYHSYQNKIFYNRYKTALKRDLQGYYIDTSKDNQTHFKAQGVDILDTGDKLTAKGSDLKLQVALMLDIAQAKGWNLQTLKITGNEAFKNEVEKQINEHIKAQLTLASENAKKNNERRDERQIAIMQDIDNFFNTRHIQEPIKRTYSPLDSTVRAHKENAKKHAHHIQTIKDFYNTANIRILNEFLMDSEISALYMPNLAQPIGNFYEQQGDRVLDKRTGRSKSIIDFFTKDAKVPMQTALAWLDKHRIKEIEAEKKRQVKEKTSELDRTQPQIPQNREVSHESSSAVNQQAKSQETRESPQITPNTKAKQEKNMQNIENKMSAINKAIADMNAVKPRPIDILGQPSMLSQEQETDKTTPSVEIEKEKKPKNKKIKETEKKKSKQQNYGISR